MSNSTVQDWLQSELAKYSKARTPNERYLTSIQHPLSSGEVVLYNAKQTFSDVSNFSTVEINIELQDIKKSTTTLVYRGYMPSNSKVDEDRIKHEQDYLEKKPQSSNNYWIVG